MGRTAARYHTALGSLKEVLACFDVATALGYTPGLDAGRADRFQKIIATLIVLVR